MLDRDVVVNLADAGFGQQASQQFLIRADQVLRKRQVGGVEAADFIAEF